MTTPVTTPGTAPATTAADLRAEGRARVRRQLRDLALDATRETVLARGWGAVRMGAVAATVGTSRQTLHGEFGTKEDLGQALVLRETSLFFEAVADSLGSHAEGPVETAVAAAAEIALRLVEANPLLQVVLGGGPEAGDYGLLPLVTSRSEPLLDRGRELFGAWLAVRRPDLDDRLAAVTVESTVRLLISHAVAPTGPSDRAAADLALVVGRLVGR